MPGTRSAAARAGSGQFGSAALAAGFVVMWSSGFIGGRLGTATASTPTLMVWRFVIVAAALGATIIVLRRRRPDRRAVTWREITAQAVVGVLGQGVYIWANVAAIEFGVGPGTAALIAALQPITVGAVAGPILGEHVQPRQWVGLGLGLLGVFLVVAVDLSEPGSATLWTYGLPFLGMAALVVATLIERSTDAATTPLVEALTIQTTASAGLFVCAALLGGHALPPPDQVPVFAVAVAWFIVFSTIGAYGFYWLVIRRTGATRLSSLIYLSPPVTTIWAWLMFGDPITIQAVAGLGVCALAVALVHYPDNARSARSHSTAR